MHAALSPELIAAIEAGACVLTPNQRSAHALKLRYANYALAQGRKTWLTPQIDAIGTFAVKLWRARANRTERVLTTEQSRLLWERIVDESSWSDALLSPQSAASTSFRSWELLQAWQIDRAALAEIAARADSAEAQALLEWSDRFEAQCKQRSWLPIALLPQRLRADTLNVSTRIVIVSEDELPPNQHALIDYFKQQGAELVRIPARQANSQVQVVQCESSELELNSSALWARAQLEGGAGSIGIAVSNLDDCAAEVRRAFAEVFAQPTRTLLPNETEQAAQFVIANYRRLADFPLARAALDILQLCVGRASSTLVGGLLRNPFLVASTQEASQRALADARLRAQGREHYDLTTLSALARHADCPQLQRACDEASAVLHTASARLLPSAAAELIIALWRAFGWPGERALNSDEQQIAARMQASLAEFGALDELLGPQSFASAAREFESLVRATRFEPRSAPAPITVIDAQAVEELQFDALWVTGMDETRWPPPAAPDPFIPLTLQVRAGMPNANAALAREQARRRFDVLRRGASNVVMSWAQHDDDVEVLPSPWLREISASHAIGNTDTSHRYAERILAAKPVLELIHESHAPRLSSSKARGGARIFELQAQCPFRAFGELRLEARPLDEVVPNVDARQRGTLLHAALADIWRDLKDSSGLHAQTPAQLETLVRTSLARHAAPLLDGASPHRVRMLQIEQNLATDRIIALLNVDRTRSDFKVVGRPETPEQLRVGALNFELRLDRVDELLGAHGGRVIVDYKTGTVSTTSWLRERPEQPQLPLYAATHPDNLAAVAFATLGAHGVDYQGVAKDDGLLPNVKAFDKELPSPHVGWSGLQIYWHDVVTRLADEFARGDAQVDPLPTACRHCHLSTLCRVHERRRNDEEDAA